MNFIDHINGKKILLMFQCLSCGFIIIMSNVIGYESCERTTSFNCNSDIFFFTLRKKKKEKKSKAEN